MLLTGHVLCKLIFPTTLACKLENTKEKHPQCIFLNSSLVSVMGNAICQVQDLKKKILEGMLLTGHTFFNFFGSLYFAKNK